MQQCISSRIHSSWHVLGSEHKPEPCLERNKPHTKCSICGLLANQVISTATTAWLLERNYIEEFLHDIPQGAAATRGRSSLGSTAICFHNFGLWLSSEAKMQSEQVWSMAKPNL